MTSLLLDTHAMLWFFWDSAQLSAHAKALIECADNRKLVSLDHATMVEALVVHHRDPFDRLLIAQAMTENLPLVSVDGIFDQYGINRLW